MTGFRSREPRASMPRVHVGTAQVDGLSEDQRRYLRQVDELITENAGSASHLRRRFKTFTMLGIFAAAAVPVCIAAQAPLWVAAVLGGLAAVAQGIEQALQDQRRSTEFHLTAMTLSNARRALEYRIARAPTSEAKAMLFDEFFAKAEVAIESGSTSVIRIAATGGPPQ